jgi:hypothetical protein
MKKLTIFLSCVFMGSLLFSQVNSPALTEGANLLFSRSKSKLTNEEKNWFFKDLGFTLSKDKKKFMSADYEVALAPYVTDMNKDGKEEVFFVMKSDAVFGNVGESFKLYTRGGSGKFELQPDLGGGIAMIMDTKNLGYPDIAIGGPGMEFPLCRWNGKQYKYYKDIKDADLQNNKVKYSGVEEYSKSYTDTLK